MKKGFTLIELLGVIILLSVIALIAYPIIDGVIKQSKERAYQQQIVAIINSAKMYAEEENLKETEYIQSVTLSSLKEKGYLKDGETKNPIDNSNMNGCVLYYWNQKSNQFEFEYNNDCERSTFASCFTFDDKSHTITGYNRECGNSVIIPSKINGKEVKHIGNSAFSYVTETTNAFGSTYVAYIVTDEKDCAGGCVYVIPYTMFFSSDLPNTVTEFHILNFYLKGESQKVCYTKNKELIEVQEDKIYSIDDGYIACGYKNMYQGIYDYCDDRDNRNDILCLKYNKYYEDTFNYNNIKMNYMSTNYIKQKYKTELVRDYEVPSINFKQGDIERVSFQNAKYLETIGKNAFAYNKIRTVDFGQASNIKEIQSLAFILNNISNLDLSELKAVEKIDTMAFAYNSYVNIDLSKNNKLYYMGESSFCSIHFDNCGSDELTIEFPTNSMWGSDYNHYGERNHYLFSINCNVQC